MAKNWLSSSTQKNPGLVSDICWPPGIFVVRPCYLPYITGHTLRARNIEN